MKPFSLKEFHHIRNSLADTFAAVASAYPENPALTCGETTASYEKLQKDIRRVQVALSKRVGNARVIVTKAENTYAHAVSILAILFSGRILCPVNPTEPAAQTARRVSALSQHFVVDTEDLIKETDTGPSPQLDSAIHHDRVYVFTSGSTGESKIVRQTEAMIMTNAEALIRHHRLQPGKVIATPLPLFHVNALEFALLCSVLSGSHLVLFSGFRPAEWAGLLREKPVDIVSLIPPMIPLLSRVLKETPAMASNIGYVVSAATALPISVAREFFDRTGVRINQGYGLSEAVNFSCLTPIDLDEETYAQMMFCEGLTTVGTAVWGNEADVILDGRSCLEREIGEIVIRGWNVMPGYLGTPRDEQAALKTGDLGYYVNRGGRRFFYISGRAKDCIKRSGETIPLREVDDVVATAAIAGVDAIAVPFVNDFTGEEIGMVCKIAGDPADGWKAQLISVLQGQLSPAMRPKLLVIVTEDLRTASGKPQRWKFSSRFAEFRSRLIGLDPVWL